MKRKNYGRLTRRINGITLLIAAIVGTLVGVFSYRLQYCSDLRAKGLQASERHNWQFASEQLKSYMRCSPSDQQALDAYIEASYQNRDFDETRRLIRYTQKLFPYDPIPQYWNGALLVIDKSNQDLPKAIAELNDVRDQIQKSFPQVDLLLGIANIENGDPRTGCEHLRTYLNAHNDNANEKIQQSAELAYQNQCLSIDVNTQ